MKSKISPTYLQQPNFYNILGELKVSIDIHKNPYDLHPDFLFAMAARQNTKRGFLFVSKVLGKHIPVKPYTPLLAGGALAALYIKTVYGTSVSFEENIISALKDEMNQGEVYSSIMGTPMKLPEPTLFMGFAETATALGYSVFQCFDDGGMYIHTTRESIKEKNFIFEFQEEHSHATTHRLYALDEDILKSSAPIVLIDDEITTGNTTLNLIEQLHKTYPRKIYTVVSLLDWRSEMDKKRFEAVERRLGICINTVALLVGTIEVEGQPIVVRNNINEEACLTQDSTESRISIHKLQKIGDFFNPLLFSSIDGNNNPYIKESGRFGIASKDRRRFYKDIQEVAKRLSQLRKGGPTLSLGTGEFMHVPMSIATLMGEGVVYHSTTRSPIHPSPEQGYGVKNAFVFPCPYDETVLNYIYNVPYGYYDDLFVFFEREVEEVKLQPLIEVLKNLGIPEIHVVFCVGNDDRMTEPDDMGSYGKEDVVFLLKDIGEKVEEKGTEDREEAIQGGVHYSEMLPVEYEPTEEYMDLFYKSLEESTEKLAIAVGVVSERILKLKGSAMALASLARAGTPIGILIKRYFKIRYHLNIPHYSISIIRGKGIDENAIRYIMKSHPQRSIQFVDGWTGKGAIAKVLTKACEEFEEKYGILLDDDLAVLADPGYCVKTYGTREDFLIASSCLNSTVSGLVSRTVHREDLVESYDFHGAKFYKELSEEDVSNLFIDTVTSKFLQLFEKIDNELREIEESFTMPNWLGWEDIKGIKEAYGIEDINLIKPGIGETTRVLLRRVPWKILIKDENSPNLKHILLLAKDKNVPVEVYPAMTYQCCGLIKPLESD